MSNSSRALNQGEMVAEVQQFQDQKDGLIFLIFLILISKKKKKKKIEFFRFWYV